MRGCYRPLLVFSNRANDPHFQQQRATVDSAADDMMDRFVLFVPVLEKQAGYQPPLDAPSILLPPGELSRLRKRYSVGPTRFHVVLLNENGTVLKQSDAPIGITPLDASIDRLPERKREMQRRDAY